VRLRAEDLAFGYAGVPVLTDVDLEAPEGCLLGLVGPNGAGKSTLLRCLYGALKPQAGRVFVNGTDISTLSPREVALRIGVVPQNCETVFPVTVAYFVGMGRFARERFLGGPTEEDREVVRRCLEEMGLANIAERPVDAISGGEFRRALIAQALTQETPVLLFDEPVQQLDLLHQFEVMDFARAFAHRDGTTAVVVLHELDLAARFCDRLALLHEGRIVSCGLPEEVLTVENVRSAYGVEATIRRCEQTGAIQVVPLRPAT
jgi:iron complex transport system ATP-binding protein